MRGHARELNKPRATALECVWFALGEGLRLAESTLLSQLTIDKSFIGIPDYGDVLDVGEKVGVEW